MHVSTGFPGIVTFKRLGLYVRERQGLSDGHLRAASVIYSANHSKDAAFTVR